MSKENLDIQDVPAALLFPFSAIVGQELMKRALIFNAIDASIGGVLITGTRGTAKSTAARAFAELLPKIETVAGDSFNRAPSKDDREKAVVISAPFVNLPIGATEDRVLGTLNVEKILQTGEKHFEAGLLAKANRGVLYVDEINLLPDHLVDVLLDAVAMGINRVEREGVSFAHEARVILIGTMNPEEGELRPQLLDRFGLAVSVTGYFEAATRIEVVRRRIAFESNAAQFLEKWHGEESELSARIERARNSIDSVEVPDEMLERIAEKCAEAGADGLRADITAYKTARAVAAYDGRETVNEQDVDEALILVLAHRRRTKSANSDGGANKNLPPDKNDKNDKNDKPSPESEKPKQSPLNKRNAPEKLAENQSESSSTDNEARQDESNEKLSAQNSAAEKTYAIGNALNLANVGSKRLKNLKEPAQIFGRRNYAEAKRVGQTVRALLPKKNEKLDLAIEATVINAAIDFPAQNAVEKSSRLQILPVHWRHRQRKIRTRNLIIFLVDASGSMAAQTRMQTAKGAIASLLEDSYQKRDAVALVAFRGESAIEILPPTRSQIFAYRRLAELPTGGRTPLAAGLEKARQIIERQARKGERVQPFLVLVSDGRATSPDKNAFESAIMEAANLQKLNVRGLCIDTEAGRLRFGNTGKIAEILGADCVHINDLPTKEWGNVVREWVAADTQAEFNRTGN